MLPKNTKPLFDITIPSLKKKTKFRPYLVGEEKILLMALEGGQDNDAEIINAVKQIINNCCQDPSIDVDSLATFDLDYIYLKLYGKSVNNKVKVSYKDLQDEKDYSFEINLDTIEIIEDPDHENKIKVMDDVTLKLKYPTLEILNQVDDASTPTEVLDAMLLNCVDSIYDSETVYTEYSEPELKEWIDKLDVNAFEKIKRFFETLPKINHTIEYTNEQGTQRRIELTNLKDFFSW